MRTFTGALAEAAQQLRDTLPFVWLYEVETPEDPPKRVRITNYSSDVTFGASSAGEPLVYSTAAVIHGGIDNSGASDLPTISITIADATFQVARLMETHSGFEGMPVVIRLVHLSDLSNEASQIREDAVVERGSVRVLEGGCAATLVVSGYNLRAIKVPSRNFNSRDCNFPFGGEECGYDILTGLFSKCEKTLAACEVRGDDEVSSSLPRQHPERWGGYRGVRGRR